MSKRIEPNSTWNVQMHDNGTANNETIMVAILIDIRRELFRINDSLAVTRKSLDKIKQHTGRLKKQKARKVF